MAADNVYETYDDPEAYEPVGAGHRRSRRPLSSHLPIRFSPEVLAHAKELAVEDGVSISTWIRNLVEREVTRRRSGSTTYAEVSNVGFVVSVGAAVSGHTLAPKPDEFPAWRQTCKV